MMICKKCGNHVAEGLFCDKCGGRLEEAATVFCPNCGSGWSEGTDFCGDCGTRLVKSEPENHVENPVSGETSSSRVIIHMAKHDKGMTEDSEGKNFWQQAGEIE